MAVEHHQAKSWTRCEHCQHQPDRSDFAGCLPSLLAFALVMLAALLVAASYRWTSIEDGCVVERRLSWSASVATERVCVGDG